MGTRREDLPMSTEPLEGGLPDALFAEQRRRVDDFDFGKNTAVVFDDMLDRSVPFYSEIQRMVAELAVDFAADGTTIYDLGCSTATTIVQIDRGLPPELNIRYVGIDSSPEMLVLAEKKLAERGVKRPCELRHGDLNASLEIANASVVLLVLTLQFVRPLH